MRIWYTVSVMPISSMMIVTLAEPRAAMVKARKRWVYVEGDKIGDPPDGMRSELTATIVGESRRPSRCEPLCRYASIVLTTAKVACSTRR